MLRLGVMSCECMFYCIILLHRPLQFIYVDIQTVTRKIVHSENHIFENFFSTLNWKINQLLDLLATLRPVPPIGRAVAPPWDQESNLGAN